MNLTEFYNHVSRKVDTKGTEINVATTKRVLSIAFDVLAEMNATEAADTIAKGLARATKTQSKK